LATYGNLAGTKKDAVVNTVTERMRKNSIGIEGNTSSFLNTKNMSTSIKNRSASEMLTPYTTCDMFRNPAIRATVIMEHLLNLFI
jgi:hypothetical protein